jgi:hypothetical protein
VLQRTKSTSRGRFSNITGNADWFLIPVRANQEKTSEHQKASAQ